MNLVFIRFLRYNLTHLIGKSLCANNHSRYSLLQYHSVYSYFTLIR